MRIRSRLARGRVSRLVLIPALLALLALFVAGCGQGAADEWKAADGIVIVLTTPLQSVPFPTRTATPTPSPTPTATPLQVCSPNPDPAPPSVLQVEEPKPQQKVGVPFHVRGWGSSEDFGRAGVAIAVVDTQQQVLQVLEVPPQPRAYRVAPLGLAVTEFTYPFAADVSLSDLREPTPICLWVYLETTPDGKPKGVLQVPVLVSP